MSTEPSHPPAASALAETLHYQSGFAQEFATEALPGALPQLDESGKFALGPDGQPVVPAPASGCPAAGPAPQ